MKRTAPRKDISAAVQQEYSHLASDYDNRWSYYVWTSLSETEKRLALSDTDLVLDVGCGTGTLFELIASKYIAAGMVGVDLSKEMLGRRPEEAERMRIALRRAGEQAAVSVRLLRHHRLLQRLPLFSQSRRVPGGARTCSKAQGQARHHRLVRRLYFMPRLRFLFAPHEPCPFQDV